jgi:DNA-binding FrmR family transcriptional regulator
MNSQDTTMERTIDRDMTAMPERHHHHSASYEADKAKILTRLRRIEGQVRGVHKMVEDDKYCVEVLTQISAIVAGLRATGQVVLEDHIRGCVLGADPDEQEALLEELMGAIERFNRSIG